MGFRSVDLNGLNSIELKEAYDAVSELQKLGKMDYMLHVDPRVLKSGFTPKKKFHMTDKKVTSKKPLTLEGLKAELKAAKLLKDIIENDVKGKLKKKTVSKVSSKTSSKGTRRALKKEKVPEVPKEVAEPEKPSEKSSE